MKKSLLTLAIAVAFATPTPLAFAQQSISTGTGGSGGAGGTAAGGAATGGTATNSNNTSGVSNASGGVGQGGAGGSSTSSGGNASSAGGNVGTVSTGGSNAQLGDVTINYNQGPSPMGKDGFGVGVDPTTGAIITDNTVRYQGSYKLKNTPDVGVGGPASGPCNGFSAGVGFSVAGFGIGGNTSTVDEGCTARETARVAAMIGRMDIANAVLENLPAVQAALRAKAAREGIINAPRSEAPGPTPATTAPVRPAPSPEGREAALREQQRLAQEALTRQATMAKANDTIKFTDAATQGNEKTPQELMAEEASRNLQPALQQASTNKQEEQPRSTAAPARVPQQAMAPPLAPAQQPAMAAAPAPAQQQATTQPASAQQQSPPTPAAVQQQVSTPPSQQQANTQPVQQHVSTPPVQQPVTTSALLQHHAATTAPLRAQQSIQGHTEVNALQAMNLKFDAPKSVESNSKPVQPVAQLASEDKLKAAKVALNLK